MGDTKHCLTVGPSQAMTISYTSCTESYDCHCLYHIEYLADVADLKEQ